MSTRFKKALLKTLVIIFLMIGFSLASSNSGGSVSLFSWSNLIYLVLGLIAIISKFIANKWSRVIKEIKDVLIKYNQAIDVNSPGGKNLTAAESKAIVKEILDVIWVGVGTVWDIPGLNLVSKLFNTKK